MLQFLRSAGQTLAATALVSLVGCGGGGSDSSSASSVAQSSISSDVPSSSQASESSLSSSQSSSPSSSSVSSEASLSSSLSSSSTASSEATVTLSGSLSYDFVPVSTQGLDYSATESRPIRGAVVNLLSASGEVLASVESDDAGDYHFEVTAAEQVQLEVEARSRRTGDQRWHLRVEDNTSGNALYAMRGRLLSVGYADSVRDLHAPSGWTGSSYGSDRVAAPFAILDTAWGVLQQVLALDPQLALPVSRFRWSIHNKPSVGEVSNGDIGTSYYDGEALYILGAADFDTDEYDRHVIAHEWAHFFEDAVGGRLDSIGGPHGQDDKLDLRVAYSEGLANAVAGFTLSDPIYLDSLGAGQRQAVGFDIARGVVEQGGWFNESSLQQVFYQWMSEVGLAPLYFTLGSTGYENSDAFASVFSFTAQLAQEAPDSLPRFTELATGQNINSLHRFAQGESNSGNTPNALPVYEELIVGQTLRVCSSQENGLVGGGYESNYNKLGYSRFIRFSPELPALYEIQVEVASTPVNEPDPDFELYWRGSLEGGGFSSEIGREKQTLALSAQKNYILSVYDYASHPNIGTAFYEPTCMDVSINAVGAEP
ncbi:hypothetical protein [Gilvimarinus chinensis]|uniref:hypothetical protein n=1 Tax=Gilvimarinus chinensis TaxID=396005 RepID=UPI0003641594|nr:hypothetical protein [Gilvimarinus chinensis]